jgi:hypothetical protein
MKGPLFAQVVKFHQGKKTVSKGLRQLSPDGLKQQSKLKALRFKGSASQDKADTLSLNIFYP